MAHFLNLPWDGRGIVHLFFKGWFGNDSVGKEDDGRLACGYFPLKDPKGQEIMAAGGGAGGSLLPLHELAVEFTRHVKPHDGTRSTMTS